MNKNIVVVLDTNIFISAVLYKGTFFKVFQLCMVKNEISIAISPELLAELIGKLKYKFGITNQTLENLQAVIESGALYVLPEYKTQICRDADDNAIIDLAICARAGFIVTGDKDLLTIKTYKKIKILTPAEFLDMKS